jgi:hypothetical protein
MQMQGNYNATGYWPKKYISMLSSYTSQNVFHGDYYPFPSMRYADLLLLTAEALNESKSQPDAEVYQYIDEVRKRAGFENGVVKDWADYSSTDPTKPTKKDGMRDIIQHERKVELACEGSYFWDSRRWKTAIKEQNNRLIQGWNVNASAVNDYYTPTTIYTQRFTLRDYFFPIPESEYINNPMLKQNWGW